MSGFNAAVMEQVRKEAVGMGQRSTLKRQIQRRFGDLPSDYLNKIDQAGEAQLVDWLDNILDAETIEQVFQ